MTRTAELLYALALETSSAAGSVALGRGADVLETMALSGPRRHAVELLPTIAEICRAHSVEPAMVRWVCVSSGPGSFTGLRIGITAARMIAFACGANIIAVPTLEVIAQNAAWVAHRFSGGASPTAKAMGHPTGEPADSQSALPPDRVAVVLDAKRGRVYAGAFVRRVGHRIQTAPTEEEWYVGVGDPVEADPLQFLASQAAYSESCAVLGEGVACHREAVEASGLPILPESLYRPRAETVYRLGIARAREGKFSDPRTLVPTYIRPPEAEERWEQRQKNRQRRQ